MEVSSVAPEFYLIIFLMVTMLIFTWFYSKRAREPWRVAPNRQRADQGAAAGLMRQASLANCLAPCVAAIDLRTSLPACGTS
jgi:hypothetical protein